MPRGRRLPKQVVVGYQTVEIRRSKLKDCDGHYMGRNDPPLIEIDKDLKGSELAVTGLHEVMHAIWHSYVPHRGILKKMKPEDLEEAVVNGLSNGLAQVIRQNPEFVLWFVQEIKR